MSELSGYEPASPLTFWNVFPSRCGDLPIFRQFFAHVTAKTALTISTSTPAAVSSTSKSSSPENSHGISAASTVVNPSTCWNLPPLLVFVRKFCCTRITLGPRAHIAFLTVADLLVAHSVCHPDSFGHLDCSLSESTIGPARDRHWLDPHVCHHGAQPWVQMLSSVLSP